MNKVVLYSSDVTISESKKDPDIYVARFIICDFSINKNGVGLNRDTIENWLSTLKKKPLVGKIKMKDDGELDFSGHNVIVVEKTDDNGNIYQDIEFDTEAFGTFTDVNIETIDGTEYIVATAEIWKRFTRACEIILKRASEGTLHTSWEISVVEEVKRLIDGSISRVINDGRFIGHCLLGDNVSPAYDSSGLLEVASKNNEDIELSKALSQDLLEIESFNKDTIEKEDKQLGKAKKKEVSEELKNEETSNVEVEEEKTKNVDKEDAVDESIDTKETSALTDFDLRNKIRDACREKLDDYCYVAFHFPVEKTVWVEKLNRESELDYVLFTYEVDENDEVTVSEPQDVKLMVSVSEINDKIKSLQSEIDTKNESIIKSGTEIKDLKTQISELVPFKEKFEQAEQEKIEAELAEQRENLISKYTKTGLITHEEFETSEDLKEYVETLNESKLKEVVATRFMEMQEEDSVEIEVSTNEDGSIVLPKAHLLENEETVDVKTIIKNYIGK